MAIDLSENGEGYNDLKAHIGHKIVCVSYGNRSDPVNVALECENCSCVLVDFNEPEQEKTCKKCGTPLNKKGLCKDLTCPYSDCSQNETFTKG